ncbi:MAG: YceI family protein [Nitrospirota bacterium]
MNQRVRRWTRTLAAAAVIAGLPGMGHAETARFNVDLDHSIVGFDVAHMVVSRTTGRFTDFQGSVVMDPDTKEFKTIDAVIQTASVNTNNKKRDDHLRSPDFFNAAKHPTMTFKMKSYTKTGDQYTATGDLTLLGVTKEISLTGTFNGAVADPYGNTRVGFTGEGTINRKDFGMQWTKTMDKGGLVVGDTVKIRLEIEAIQEKKKG